MRRLLGTWILAIVLLTGSAGTAPAQIVYGYTVPNAGGIVQGANYFYPGGYRGFATYYSPWTGAASSAVYDQNFLGQIYGRSFAYHPWTGTAVITGYYVPNYWVAPFAGYNYAFVQRWPLWGWRWR